MKRTIIVTILITILATLALPSALAARQTPAVPTSYQEDGMGVHTECAEDLTGETLTFVHFGDLSGPFRGITQPLLAGIEDALAYFNGNGGLCGATIVTEYEDTAGDQDKTQEFWNQFVTDRDPEDRPDMILLYSSADGEILRGQAEEMGVPILLAAGSELALYGEEGLPGWVFSVIPLYTDQLGLFCEYVSENWDMMGIEGDPVIGHLSWGIAFGRASDTPETQAYCESLGVGYAGAEYFSPAGTPDVGPQLKNLTDNGANIIYSTTLATGADTVIKAVAGAGLLDQVIIAGTNWILDTSVYGLAGADANHVYGTLPYLWWDDLANPGIQIVTTAWVTNRFAPAGDDPELQRAAFLTRNIAYMLAFTSLDIWIEVMIRGINEVGYENMNGAAAYDVLTNDFAFDALMGVMPVAYDETIRSVLSAHVGQIQFVEVEGNVTPSIVPITELRSTPDLRTGGADVPAMEE